MSGGGADELDALARAAGLQLSYVDLEGRERHASPDTVRAVLASLGFDPGAPRDALEEVRESDWRRVLDPLVVVWGDAPLEVDVRLPASFAATARVEVATRTLELRAPDLPELETERVDGERWTRRRLAVPGPIPQGVHELRLEAGERAAAATVLAAPPRAPDPPRERGWGVFLPLYALRSARSLGIGDLGDLRDLAAWVGSRGGELVGILPLLSAWLDEPYDPSPYSPVSRLFWNELYLDVGALPEMQASPEARALVASPEFREEQSALSSADVVDPRAAMRLKRRLLDDLSTRLTDERERELERFLAEHPEVSDYARFRAVTERRRELWPDWPTPLREGHIRPGDYDEGTARTYEYAQWSIQGQLAELAAAAGTGRAGLYVDLPLGVDPAGYDVYRHRDLYARGVSVGAPPDPFFSGGQDWGFPPLHPGRIATGGHELFARVLRESLRYATALRIDHVMSLRRLYVVPHGASATDGVYVRYPSEALHAIVCLEAQRSRCSVVGEDLGTVPDEVREDMRRHGLRRMHVVQFELSPDREPMLADAPTDSLACLNTHDMPTFAGFWRGDDVDLRRELGLLAEEEIAGERAARERLRERLVRFLRGEGRAGADADVADVLAALLERLAGGPAETVLVNLEDLWLETRPQNVPGTGAERPNFRRRARLSLEELESFPPIQRVLERIDATRNVRGGE